MNAANGSPCRHCGAPPEEIIDHIVNLIHISLSENDSMLNGFGLTRDEYVSALPAAIERIRGRLAASNHDRRQFAETFLAFLRERGAISHYTAPSRTSDTVYRIELEQSRTIALIQKGCPDGAHSSANWHRPAWADELYLWWICNSLQQHPGEHVWRGASRIMKKLASNPDERLDGVIFFSPLCGTPQRPCPRQQRAQLGTNIAMPPPCVYVVHDDVCHHGLKRKEAATALQFPERLLGAFGISAAEAPDNIGYINFQQIHGRKRKDISMRFGTARCTSVRG